MFKIVKAQTSSEEMRLPRRDSDQSLANKFAEFYHGKVAAICVSLDATEVDSMEDNSVQTTGLLMNFTPVSKASLTKLITRAPSKPCILDPIPTRRSFSQ